LSGGGENLVPGPWACLRATHSSSSPAASAALDQLRAKAETIKDEENSYSNFSCAYDDITKELCVEIERRIKMKPVIHKTTDEYCAYIKLIKSFKEYFCVDSTGHRGYTSINPSGIGYCDGQTFICPPN